MIDFILAVDRPSQWHRLNIASNPNHYSFLRWMGADFVARYQESGGAKIYYNTLIPHENTLVKYGVISTSALITDLLDWDCLYVSGRLHKPVLVLKTPESEALQVALRHNLESALHASLLMLPESFSERDLYITLARLSYMGDFRMIFGEKKTKVSDIVDAQSLQFRELYLPLLKEMSMMVELNVEQEKGEQDTSPEARMHHYNMLPKTLQKALVKEWNKDGKSRDVEEVMHAAAYDMDSHDLIEKGIRDVVFPGSTVQSLKSILAAGLWKSLRYSGRKIRKMMRSSRK